MRVEWTQDARQQFKEQRDYYRREAPHKLDHFIHAIIDAEQKAATSPDAWRMIPEELHPKKREFLVWSYRLMYRIEAGEQKIYIPGLYHQRQQFKGF